MTPTLLFVPSLSVPGTLGGARDLRLAHARQVLNIVPPPAYNGFSNTVDVSWTVVAHAF